MHVANHGHEIIAHFEAAMHGTPSNINNLDAKIVVQPTGTGIRVFKGVGYFVAEFEIRFVARH
ncbi:uncharacterized protein METZ01_LOCUS218947, partial [marine metagenome]